MKRTLLSVMLMVCSACAWAKSENIYVNNQTNYTVFVGSSLGKDPAKILVQQVAPHSHKTVANYNTPDNSCMIVQFQVGEKSTGANTTRVHSCIKHNGSGTSITLGVLPKTLKIDTTHIVRVTNSYSVSDNGITVYFKPAVSASQTRWYTALQ